MVYTSSQDVGKIYIHCLYCRLFCFLSLWCFKIHIFSIYKESGGHLACSHNGDYWHYFNTLPLFKQKPHADNTPPSFRTGALAGPVSCDAAGVYTHTGNLMCQQQIALCEARCFQYSLFASYLAC